MNRQTESFQAETTWFHIFKSMIESGDVASMGPHAVTVYLVIKSYANYSTGFSFPNLKLISEKSGISLAQVKRCLNTLAEHGYVIKEKKGRHNVYSLREKVNISDSSGRPTAVATWDYLPSTVKAAQAELRNFLLSGEDDNKLQYIHVERLTLNVQVGDHNQQINLGNVKDKAVVDKVRKLSTDQKN